MAQLSRSPAGDPVSRMLRAGARSMSMGFRRRLQVDAVLTDRQPDMHALLSSMHACLSRQASGFLRSVACRVNINLSSYPLLNSILAEQQPPALIIPGKRSDETPLALPGLDTAPSAVQLESAPLLQHFLDRADRIELLYACLLSDLSNMAYEVSKVEDSELLRHNLTLVSSSALPLYGPFTDEPAAGTKSTSPPGAQAPGPASSTPGQPLPTGSAAPTQAQVPSRLHSRRTSARSAASRRRSMDAQVCHSSTQITASAGADTGAGLQAAATSPPRSSSGAAAASRSPKRSHLPSVVPCPPSGRTHGLGSTSVNHALPAAVAATAVLQAEAPSQVEATPLAAPAVSDELGGAKAHAKKGSGGGMTILPSWPWPWRSNRANGDMPKDNASALEANSPLAAVTATSSEGDVSAALSSSVSPKADAAAMVEPAAPAARPAPPPAPPAAWFSADDLATKTRYMIIQGSTSFDHWVINLNIEPVPFEDPALGVRVHRGVYEAAIQLYEDLLPLVRQHLASSPDARVALGGHSLGGSVAAVIMLLLVCRGGIAPERLAPSYAFGAPAVFCAAGAGGGCPHDGPSGHKCQGCMSATASSTTPALGSVAALAPAGGGKVSPGAGARVVAAAGIAEGRCLPKHSLMSRLGIPEALLTNVVMHKDIVPRAFLCNYTVVADWLKRFMPSFKDHTTLSTGHDHKYLYTYIGTVAVLRPDDNAPFVQNDNAHPMLPNEAGLYKLIDPHRKAGGTAAVPLAAPVPAALVPPSLPAAGGIWGSFLPSSSPGPAPACGGPAASCGGGAPTTSVASQAAPPPALPSLRSALLAFMDYPHPLQSLSSLSSYGSDGAISRYHNPANYTRGLVRLLEPLASQLAHLPSQ